MASAEAKIRHVFGFTFSWRAAPPVIVQLSGLYPQTFHCGYKTLCTRPHVSESDLNSILN